MRQGKRKDCLFSRYNGDMIKLPKIPLLLVFFPQYSALTISGQATQTSHTILKGFRVLTVITATVILLLPSSTLLHKDKTRREEGQSGKDGHAGLNVPKQEPFFLGVFDSRVSFVPI